MSRTINDGTNYPPPISSISGEEPSAPLRPSCMYCGKPADTRRYKNGKHYYYRVCNRCRRRPYMRHRKRYCELCGLVPWTMAVLEVHHIDENNKNNELDNLVTVCSNCHRYIHWPDMKY